MIATGGARSAAVRAIAPTVFGRPELVPERYAEAREKIVSR